MIPQCCQQNNVCTGQVNKQPATPGLSFVTDTVVAVFAVTNSKSNLHNRCKSCTSLYHLKKLGASHRPACSVVTLSNAVYENHTCWMVSTWWVVQCVNKPLTYKYTTKHTKACISWQTWPVQLYFYSQGVRGKNNVSEKHRLTLL